ncbi:hypothetical protein ZWY2020_046073, partial [Hordeum vulgare]
IGVSLGSHRPTVLLKLCLVEKKLTNDAACCLKKLEQHCMRTYYPSLGTRANEFSIYLSQLRFDAAARRDFFFISPRLGRCPPRAIVSCYFHLVLLSRC